MILSILWSLNDQSLLNIDGHNRRQIFLMVKYFCHFKMLNILLVWKL